MRAVLADSIKIPVANAVVLVCDQSGGQVPSMMNGMAIATTNSCVAIGCRAQDDGETELTLGAHSEFERLGSPAFETTLQLPGRRVVIRSVTGEELLGLSVEGEVVQIKIWTNHGTEPDWVVLGVG
jgi:hypothetical protein